LFNKLNLLGDTFNFDAISMCYTVAWLSFTMTDREHHRSSDPLPLPVELVAALADVEYACLTIGTDAGTGLLLKAPQIEIAAVRGRIPVSLGHELYNHPAAPVIRIALRLYDQPQSPLAMETFINIADEAQRADYAALASQDEIPLIFLDKTHQQRLGHIPAEQFDFERAKQAVIESTHL